MNRFLTRILCLAPGDLGRLAPFFGVYAVLFAALTLADGIALVLFVSRVGADALPGCYALTAILSIIAVGGYVRLASRKASPRVFRAILTGGGLLYALGWAGLVAGPSGNQAIAAALFAAREIASVLVLAHFGTFLQDYFTRPEMNRVLPIVYAGGRVGGLAGGASLEWLGPALGVSQLAAVVAALMIGASMLIGRLARAVPPVDEPAPIPGETAGGGAGIGRLVRMPLFGWFAASSGLFMVVRWFLNYEYNHYFESHFQSEAELAAFLGRYAQIALLVSLVVQVLLVNRLVGWVGIRGAHALTVLLLVAGMGRNLGPMTLAAAVWSRMLESELRFGLRNPVNQLVTNQFAKPDRVRVRAWTLGGLNPLATLSSSLMLGALQGSGMAGWIPAAGFALALAHAGTSLALYTYLREPGRVDHTPPPTAHTHQHSHPPPSTTRAMSGVPVARD